MRVFILYPQDSGSLLYPSVTFCTKYIWQSFPGVRKIFEGKGVFVGVRDFLGVKFQGQKVFQRQWSFQGVKQVVKFDEGKEFFWGVYNF